MHVGETATLDPGDPVGGAIESLFTVMPIKCLISTRSGAPEKSFWARCGPQKASSFKEE